jgi:hypothetical protein
MSKYRLVAPPVPAHRVPRTVGLSWLKHDETPDEHTQRNAVMIKNSDYVARMETQLKNWDADLDALAAKGEKASAEMRAAYHERIRDLRASRGAVQTSLQQLSAATESAGTKMQAGMQVAWETMQKALEKVSADLRK